MRIYENDKIAKIICNSCGKELKLKDGILMDGCCYVQTEWGYFSEKDGENHQFDLCEACYDAMIARFRIPVSRKERTELLS